MPIPVGVLLNAEYSPAELGRLGRLCEELGYDHLWYTDIRLFRECYIGLAALTTLSRRATSAVRTLRPNRVRR